jgi:RNA polymerase sporulation-specific sigma factor
MKLRMLWVKLLLRLGMARSIYYIGSTETLPPPLSAEEEAELLANLDGDRRFRSILVERNLRLVIYIAKKFENTGIGMEDIISIGTIGLMKAANTFRPDKNIKLATYASRCIENEILMYIRKNGNIRTELSIDEPLSTDYDGNELLLSDVLGTDEDSATRALEEDEEKKIIYQAIADERELNPTAEEIQGAIGEYVKADTTGLKADDLDRFIKEYIRDELVSNRVRSWLYENCKVTEPEDDSEEASEEKSDEDASASETSEENTEDASAGNSSSDNADDNAENADTGSSAEDSGEGQTADSAAAHEN